MKAIFICIFFILQVMFVHATDNSIKTANLSMHCERDIQEVGYQELIPIEEYVFSNGIKINASEENAQPIMLINGSFRADIKAINNNNRLLVPIRTISEALGLKVSWKKESNKVIIENKDSTIVLKIDDTFATVNNKEYTLTSPPILINNTTYVPLRFISEKMGLKVGYYKSSEIDLFTWNPVVTIDEELNIPYISEEEACKNLKSKLEDAYNKYEDNYKKLHNPDDDYLTKSSNALKEDISNIKITKTISRYYVFEGLNNTIYLDKYSGIAYFNIRGISFSEITKIDFDDPRLFEYGYMVD
ncbi:copper amine oxidase N-terminal domain-containing protein [Tepidibacter thalassicus]|uniref:Copper amine oxidase N-terminal domain-containing protein n=1 Tax=Tepidibacter thalassicus DSM 15285 TaxID=1123350 RepID=A0A1M5SUY9_9FIRM|nr:copper amine oxidase N-terminal domain-containing protein [Tepidibacter thalassicus]SHH42299.1 Copper amine oxidase N-terminal domain-containing protein [Tepidibacter thalassicus DSM 15285]